VPVKNKGALRAPLTNQLIQERYARAVILSMVELQTS
jgi:hypothetical protein